MIKKICKFCKSDDVTANAELRWNVESQSYEISSLHEDKGGAYCSHCNADTIIEDAEIENIIHFSVADLIKKTAKQLCYLRKNPEQERPPTQQMLDGNEAAHTLAVSKYIEMRGTYRPDESLTEPYGKFLMHFAFDEIFANDEALTLVEHKMVKDPNDVPLWYIQSSVLQTAVYQALAKENPDRMLYTANFYVAEGNEKLVLDMQNRYIHSELHMGGERYSINVSNTKKLIDFYVKKAIASMDYRTAEEFDGQFRRKEYDALKSCFVYRPLND